MSLLCSSPSGAPTALRKSQSPGSLRGSHMVVLPLCLTSLTSLLRTFLLAPCSLPTATPASLLFPKLPEVLLSQELCQDLFTHLVCIVNSFSSFKSLPSWWNLLCTPDPPSFVLYLLFFQSTPYLLTYTNLLCLLFFIFLLYCKCQCTGICILFTDVFPVLRTFPDT